MGYRAHLYPSVDSGTWAVEVLSDLAPADDDHELPLEVDDESEPLALLDTGIPESAPFGRDVEMAATRVLYADSWTRHGTWQCGNGEWTIAVSVIDFPRLAAWDIWAVMSMECGLLAGDAALLRQQAEARIAEHGVSSLAVHVAAATMLDEITTGLRDLYGDDGVTTVLHQMQGPQTTSDERGVLLQGLLCGGTVGDWLRERPAEQGGVLAVLYPLAVVLSGAFDRAAREEGLAAAAYAGSTLALAGLDSAR